MGGVRTKPNGESPTLKGLFAAGEAACWDMHGFNRLGGNSVAETVVAGMIVSEYVADWCDSAASDLGFSTALVQGFLEREQARIDALIASQGLEQAHTLRTRMQEIMTDKVGIFRTAEELSSAVDELEDLLRRSRNIGLRYRAVGANPELVAAYRTQKMLKVALCVAHGALMRTESRGAHYRNDHPRRDDAQWLKRTLAVWTREDDTLPTLTYEALDVMAMELPPGWRGYGARDYLDHPETAGRTAEVEKRKAEHAAAGRYAVQAALMPYEHLLPARYRGLNERLDEPLPSRANA
jgi:fumarate reductase flavoprotein subunit